MGGVGRLAEVMRRRECLISAPTNPSSGAGSSSHVADSTRALTVADLRQAERAPPPAPVPVVRRTYKGAFAATREAAAALHTWLKRQPHLREVPVATGESSVALLLLWEADHGALFPSRVTEMKQRLGSFTKNLLDAVAADSELSKWVDSKVINFQLTPGVPFNKMRRWSVRIDSAVGEPFLSSWKAHLLTLVRGPGPVVTSAGSGPPPKRPRHSPPPSQGEKRKRPGPARPPEGSRRARVERLQAAKAALPSEAPPLPRGGSDGSTAPPSHVGPALPGVLT